jgi:hypothetical protein
MTDQIETFIREHRDHGQVVGDAAEPMTKVRDDYYVSLRGSCFIHWVTSTEATIDPAASARLN